MCLVKLRHWATQCTCQLVHLFNDSDTAVTNFQAGDDMDVFIQAYARELNLSCAQFYITFEGVTHTPG